MRLKIVLAPTTEPSFVPLDHHPFASLIYQTVAQVNPAYAEFLHDQGFSQNVAAASKFFKFFTYSRPYLPPTLLQKGQDTRAYFARGEIVWQISSPMPEFMQSMALGLMSRGEIVLRDQLGAAHFKIVSMEELLLPAWHAPMRCKTLSPITVSVAATRADGQRQKQFLWPDDPRFAPAIIANLQNKFRVLFDAEPPAGAIQFSFDENYIQRRGGVRKISKLAQYKGANIRGFQAPFTLSAPPELLRVGYECGLGEANSKGFGMIEIAPAFR